MPYSELLGVAKLDPDTVDFKELRSAYAMSPDYAPYALDKEGLALLNQAHGEGNAQMMATMAERLLKSNYLDIDAHLAAAAAYKGIGDAVRSSYHAKFWKRLLDSIVASGNGRTCQTAFTVISVAEEYALLKALRIQPVSQSLMDAGGHHFDVFEYVNGQTGETMEMYFNIDLPTAWLGKNVKPMMRQVTASGRDKAEAQPEKRKRHNWWQPRK